MAVRKGVRTGRLGAIAVLVFVIGSVAWVLLDAAQAALVSTAAGILLSGGSLLLDYLAHCRSNAAPVRISERADELAVVAEGQWLAEAQARGLRDSGVLALEWAGHDGDSFELRAGDSTPAASRVVRVNLSGRMDGAFETVARKLAQRFADIPGGRVVLLGEPGAGKTVLGLLLTIGLMRRRRAGGPVPLFLSISGWDPVLEPLTEWLARVVAASYYGGRPGLALELLRAQLLLPILDGLDEIPESSRRHAIKEINRVLHDEVPIVVTCRSAEYQDLIVGGSPTLARAPVIEVRPVGVDDLAVYLARLTWPVPGDWEAVLDRIRHDPHGPLAAGLSTPLTISLARTIFQHLDLRPAELLDQNRFATRHAIENWLVDHTVAAAYTMNAADPAQGRDRGTRATKFLSSVAHFMHITREKDLAWWKLGEQLLSRWFGPVLGILAGLTAMAATVLTYAVAGGGVASALSLRFAASAGLAFAILVTVFWSSGGGARPRRIAFRLRGSAARIKSGFGTGARAATVTVLPVFLAYVLIVSIGDTWSMTNLAQLGNAVFASLALIFVSGAAVALMRWLDAAPEHAAAFDPLELVRHDRLSSLVTALSGGAVFAVLLMPALILWLWIGTLAEGLATGWTQWPGDADATAALRARLFDVASRFFPSPVTMVYSLVVLPGVAFTVLMLLTRAWPRYFVSSLALALQRRLPWRLSAFLDDAYRRGVLRRSGDSYQFKHARLQEQLALVHTRKAGAATEPPPSAAPVVASPRGWSSRTRMIAGAAALALLSVVVVLETPRANSRLSLAGAYGKGPYTVTFSPKGDLIALYSSRDSLLRVLSTGDGHLRAALPISPGNVLPGVTEFSPDEHHLAIGYRAGGRTMVDLWNLDGRSREAALPVRADDTFAKLVNFGADGTTVAVLGPRTGLAGQANVVLWDIGAHRRLAAFPYSWQSPPEFGADGRTFLVFDHRKAVLRRMADATAVGVLGMLNSASNGTDDIAYSPDGTRILAGVAKWGESLWDTTSGRRVKPLGPVPEGESLELDAYPPFTRDSVAAIVVSRRFVSCIRLRDGHVLWRTSASIHSWDTTALNSDCSIFVSLQSEGKLIVVNRGVLGSFRLPFFTTSTAIQLLQDGRYVALDIGGDSDESAERVLLANVASKKVITLKDGKSFRRFDVVGSGDRSQTFPASGAGGTLRFYRLTDGRPTFQAPDPDSDLDPGARPTDLRAWFGNDRLVVRSGSGANQWFTVYDTMTGCVVRTIPHVSGQPQFFGDLAATIGTDNVIRLWRLGSWGPVAALRGHTGVIDSLTQSPDHSTLASSSNDGTVRLWDLPLAQP
jgi:WD40 repeat protein